MEMAMLRTTLNSDARLPPEYRWLTVTTASKKMVARIPEVTLTGTGVPKRFENRPRPLGPEPASAPIAIMRSAPISQTVPLVSSEKTIAAPTKKFRMLAPVPPRTLPTTV